MNAFFHIDTSDEYVRQRGRVLMLIYVFLIGMCITYMPYILFISEGLSSPGLSLGLTGGAMLLFGVAMKLAKSARIDASMLLSSNLIVGAILLVHFVERTMLPSVWSVLPAVILTGFARRPRSVAWFTIPLLSMFALLVWLLRDHVVTVKLYDEYARLSAISVAALAMSYMTVSMHQRIMPELGRIREQEQEATEAAHVLRQQAQDERMRLERAHAEKNAFLASMSHELRTPLTGIMGLSMMIEEELEFEEVPVPEEVLVANQGIQCEASTFLDMCQQALQMAEQDTDFEALHPWLLELDGFTNDVYASVRDTMRSRGMHIAIVNSLEDPLISHDSLWMRRILLSIFFFINHRNSGGEATLTLEDSADAITLRSVDRGLALDMEKWSSLEDASETFMDALPYAYRELLLVRRLALAMGGAIQVSSKEDVTELEVTLPRDLLADDGDHVEVDEVEEQQRLNELLGGTTQIESRSSRSLRERISTYYNPVHLSLEDRIPAGGLMRLFTFGTILLIGTLSWRLAALSNEPGHLPVVIIRVCLIGWTIASVELARRGRSKLAIGVTSIFLLLLTFSTTMRTMGVSASSNLYVAVVILLIVVRGAKEIVGLTAFTATIALGLHTWFGLNPVDDPLFPYYGYLPGGVIYAMVTLCVVLLGVVCARLNTVELERAKEHIRQLMRARQQEQLGRQRAVLARASTSLANQVRARFLDSLSADVDEPLRALQRHIDTIDRELLTRDDDALLADLENLKGAMARLRWLVDDVLMFAAIRAERIAPEEQEVTLQQVCEHAQRLITERLGHPVALSGLLTTPMHGITDIAHASQLLAQFALIDTEVGDVALHLEEIGPHDVTFSLTLTTFPGDDPRLQLANSMADFRSSFLQALQSFLEQDDERRVSSSNRVCVVRFRSVETI